MLICLTPNIAHLEFVEGAGKIEFLILGLDHREIGSVDFAGVCVEAGGMFVKKIDLIGAESRSTVNSDLQLMLDLMPGGAEERVGSEIALEDFLVAGLGSTAVHEKRGIMSKDGKNCYQAQVSRGNDIT